MFETETMKRIKKMTNAGKGIFKTVLLSGVAAFALAATPLSVSQFASTGDFIAQAHADDDGDAKGSKQFRGGGASKGKGGAQGSGTKGGSDAGQGGQGTHVPGGIDKGEDSDDRKGPQFGGGEAGSGGSDGGKPIWAQEGIPEVELGRLNVARAPDHVLARQLDEALTSFTEDMASFYNLPLADMIAILQDPVQFDALTRLDSPLMNLALYKDIVLNSGDTVLPGVTNDASVLSALFIGTASDKLVAVSNDTVTALNAILGLPALDDAATAALAADAQSIREAISTGHGE
jgi:hypothetical protein